MLVGFKGIVKIPMQRHLYALRRIHRHHPLLQEVERTNVIHPCQMVLVFMGIHHGIQRRHLFPQHLMAEIRSGINHHGLPTNLHPQRTSQSFVTRVFRLTHGARAPNDGNSLGRPGSQERGSRQSLGHISLHAAKVSLPLIQILP